MLSLGKLEGLDDSDRSLLAQRIDDLYHGQESLFEAPEHIERLAEHFVQRLRQKELRAEAAKQRAQQQAGGDKPQWETVDLNTIETEGVRTVGPEQVVAWGMEELKLAEEFEKIGLSARDVGRACVLVAARLLAAGQ